MMTYEIVYDFVILILMELVAGSYLWFSHGFGVICSEARIAAETVPVAMLTCKLVWGISRNNQMVSFLVPRSDSIMACLHPES